MQIKIYQGFLEGGGVSKYGKGANISLRYFDFDPGVKILWGGKIISHRLVIS